MCINLLRAVAFACKEIQRFSRIYDRGGNGQSQDYTSCRCLQNDVQLKEFNLQNSNISQYLEIVVLIPEVFISVGKEW